MNVIALGVPAGLVIGVAAWFVAGGASANGEKVAPLVGRLETLRTPERASAYAATTGLADLGGNPLFALSVGPGAVKDPVIRIEGISISPRRAAALMSIDGKPAEWVVAGDARDGVTVQQVLRTRVVVDTVLGPKELGLGEGAEPPAADTAMNLPNASRPEPSPGVGAPPLQGARR